MGITGGNKRKENGKMRKREKEKKKEKGMGVSQENNTREKRKLKRILGKERKGILVKERKRK